MERNMCWVMTADMFRGVIWVSKVIEKKLVEEMRCFNRKRAVRNLIRSPIRSNTINRGRIYRRIRKQKKMSKMMARHKTLPSIKTHSPNKMCPSKTIQAKKTTTS